jgi:hypothetical protein
VALVARHAESLALRPVHLGIARRIEGLLRVASEIGDDRFRVFGARRLDPRHHFGHQRAHVSLALHA